MSIRRHLLGICIALASPSLHAMPTGPLAVSHGFVENRGQWGGDFGFMATLGNSTAFAEPNGVLFRHLIGADDDGLHGTNLRLTFEGAQTESVRPRGHTKKDGLFHFFLGSDRDKWVRNAPWYETIEYPNVADGIDVLFHVRPDHFEYDVVLAPGARIDDLTVLCDGGEILGVDESGALLIRSGAAELRQPAPRTWMENTKGERTLIDCHYRILDPYRFGFDLPNVPEASSVVIDPGMVWSRLFYGTMVSDSPFAAPSPVISDVAVGDDGNITIFGRTGVSNLPTTPGAFQENFIGTINDLFVSRFSPDGSQLIYSTYIGGTDSESSAKMELGPDGDTFLLASVVNSSTFPTTPGALVTDTSLLGNCGFIRLSANGDELLLSGLLGGSKTETCVDIDYSETYGITILGTTSSTDFPVTEQALDKDLAGIIDIFITRISADGTKLLYSTLIGGDEYEGALAMDVDQDGAVVITGNTSGDSYPITPGAAISTPGSSFASQGFLTKFDPTLSKIEFSTYITTLGSLPRDVRLHPHGFITIFGEASLITPTPGAYNSPIPHGDDMFLIHVANDGSAIHAVTKIGTGGGDATTQTNMAIDGAGNITIVGYTPNAGFPTTPGSFIPVEPGVSAIILAKFNPQLSKLLYATYLGGYDQQQPSYLAQAPNGDVVLSGIAGFGFPTTVDLGLPPMGIGAAFIARMDLLPHGTRRIGEPTEGCQGIPAIGVEEMPQASLDDFTLTANTLPPKTGGILGVSFAAPLTTPIEAAGIDIWLDPSALVLIPVVSNAIGAVDCSFPLNTPLTPIGFSAVTQFFFPDSCANGGYAATPALKITVQP